MADIVKKVFCIGLPRCGGQTLQAALAYLVGPCVHSPGNDWESLDKYNAFTEVYIHPATLAARYGKDHCTFIVNDRSVEDWVASCASVYKQSSEWNHPIWRYPLDDFERYRKTYLEARMPWIEGKQVLNIVERPRWQELCDVLGIDRPGPPFPRVDRVKL